MQIPPVRDITRIATRHPYADTRTAAIGGTKMLARLPPAVAIAVANPRRTTNQRTTVALHGTQEQLIPRGATMAIPIATTTMLLAVAHNK